MKIIKEDQNVMILKDNNIMVFVVGLIFVLAGLMIIFKSGFFTNQPPTWSGLVGVLLGGFVIFVAKVVTVSLDKTTNKLVFLRKGLTSKTTREYALDQINEVELSMTYSSSSKSRGYSYHLAFVFSNGEIIPLNPGSSSIIKIMGRQVILEKSLGARIASFLGVPFQERRPPTVSETLSTLFSAIQSAAEKEIKKQKNM